VSTKTTPTFKVGQRVMFVRVSRNSAGSTEATVTRVGRKYVYITLDGQKSEHYDRFQADNGWQDAGGYAPRSRITTPEILEQEQRRERAMERIKAIRDPYGRSWERLSVEQIEAIAEIVEAAK